MPKISELKAKMEELERILLFETDKTMIKYYLEDYLACIAQYILLKKEIERHTFILN